MKRILPVLMLILAVSLLLDVHLGRLRAQGTPVGVAGNPSPAVETVQGPLAGGIPIPVSTTGGALCTSHAFLNNPNSGNTQIVALSGTTVIHVCDWYYQTNAAGATFKFTTGTGANCGVGTADATGTYGSNVLSISEEYHGGTLNLPAGNALCVNVGANVTAGTVEVQFAQF